MAYSQKEIDSIFGTIVQHIKDGNSLRSALRLDGMPTSETFYKWCDSDEEKATQYARADKDREDKIFNEILDIADDGTNDYMTITKGDQTYNVEDREVTSRSKLRVEARKWVLSKMNPQKYSDKLQVDQSEFEEQPLFGPKKEKE